MQVSFLLQHQRTELLLLLLGFSVRYLGKKRLLFLDFHVLEFTEHTQAWQAQCEKVKSAPHMLLS